MILGLLLLGGLALLFVWSACRSGAEADKRGFIDREDNW